MPAEGGEQSALKHLQRYIWDDQRIRTYRNPKWSDRPRILIKFSGWLAVGGVVGQAHLPACQAFRTAGDQQRQHLLADFRAFMAGLLPVSDAEIRGAAFLRYPALGMNLRSCSRPEMGLLLQETISVMADPEDKVIKHGMYLDFIAMQML